MKPHVINSCHRIKNSDSECPEGTNCEYPPDPVNNIELKPSYYYPDTCLRSKVNVNSDKLKGKSSMFLPLVVTVFKDNCLIMRCDKLSARPYRIR